METIGLIIVFVWLVSKFLGGGSNNKSSTNNKGGLNTYEKYDTFEKIRKGKK